MSSKAFSNIFYCKTLFYNQLVLALLELNSFISIFQERKRFGYFFFYSDYFLFHSKKQLVISCSVLPVVVIACIFYQGFSHPHHNHPRLLTSASGCNIPCKLHHAKVFFLQKQPAFFVENFVIIVIFIIVMPRHVKAFVLVTFSTCS